MTEEEQEISMPMKGNPAGFFYTMSLILCFSLGIIVHLGWSLSFENQIPRMVYYAVMLIFNASLIMLAIKKFKKFLGKQ